MVNLCFLECGCFRKQPREWNYTNQPGSCRTGVCIYKCWPSAQGEWSTPPGPGGAKSEALSSSETWISLSSGVEGTVSMEGCFNSQLTHILQIKFLK